MSRSKRKTLHRKSILKNKKLIAIPIVSVIVIVSISLAAYTLLQTPNKFSLKAAIIDQLGGEFPNATFVEAATGILTQAGFNTTYYGSQAVNVSFFQGLAKDNYGIIVLRAHSALRHPNNDTVDLFTSEEFNNQSYRQMWDEGYLSEGQLNLQGASTEEYFAITPNFIENIEGSFPRSIVIAMGCWGLKFGADQLAQAFVDKGAQEYIGWTNVILPKDTDTETVNLLEMLITQNLPLAKAVSQISTITYKTEPGGGIASTAMTFLPYNNANLTLSKLIATAGNSTNTPLFISLQQGLLLVTEPFPRRKSS